MSVPQKGFLPAAPTTAHKPGPQHELGPSERKVTAGRELLSAAPHRMQIRGLYPPNYPVWVPLGPEAACNWGATIWAAQEAAGCLCPPSSSPVSKELPGWGWRAEPGEQLERQPLLRGDGTQEPPAVGRAASAGPARAGVLRPQRALPWAHSVGAESYLVPGATGMQRAVSLGIALERQEGGYVRDRGLLC